MSIKTIRENDYEVTETELKKSKTQRGFGLIEFQDMYGQNCSLQDSSLATESAIWFGVDSTGDHINGPMGNRNEKVSNRMHLTKKMVSQLLPILIKFAETGDYISHEN